VAARWTTLAPYQARRRTSVLYLDNRKRRAKDDRLAKKLIVSQVCRIRISNCGVKSHHVGSAFAIRMSPPPRRAQGSVATLLAAPAFRPADPGRGAQRMTSFNRSAAERQSCDVMSRNRLRFLQRGCVGWKAFELSQRALACHFQLVVPLLITTRFRNETEPLLSSLSDKERRKSRRFDK
jgi:hypothetical protein